MCRIHTFEMSGSVVPERLRGWRRTALLLAANFVASALVPLVVETLFAQPHEHFTAAQTFGIGALTFVAVTLIEIVIELEIVRSERETERRTFQMRNDIDADLHAIRDACDDALVAASGPYLLPRHCGGLVRSLRHTVEQTVASCEIVVDETYLSLSAVLLDQFHGRPDDMISLVHRFSGTSGLFRAHEMEWLRKVDEGLRGKQINQARRLFIQESDDELDDPMVRLLLAAHQRDRKYDYRIIRADYFAELIGDYTIPAEVVDFGIYGPYAVFRGYEYAEGRLRGSYAVRDVEVERFSDAYEACWQSDLTFQHPITTKGHEKLPNSMQELLKSIATQTPAPVVDATLS